MLERLGMKSWRDMATMLCLVLLVAVSPTGNEATHPLILGIYRTLLLVIVALYTMGPDRSRLPRLSPWFSSALILLGAVMWISVLRWQGSHFEGFYALYENVLFIAAFVALAHTGLARPAAWKRSVLTFVVLINMAYMAGTLIFDKRPYFGPFVNSNYLASFMLPGIAICAATVLLASSIRLRIAAGVAGLFLYYGIAQTASRGATLAGLALLGLAGFRAARRGGISILRLGLVASLFVVLTVAMSHSLVQKFLDRGERDPYNYQRGKIWMGSLSMIGENPVSGVGLGYFSYVSKLFTPAAESTIARYRKYPNIAHSEYLQYMAEIGIPGALLLFGLGAGLYAIAWRRGGTTTAANSVVQESALLAAAGLAVHALVDNNWTVPVMAAGLAVISQADLLPHLEDRARPLTSAVWRNAFALLFIAVWLDAAVISGIGLYFNEVGHKAHLARDFQLAERNHRLALAVIPNHPVLLDNLGIVYLDEFIETKKPEYLDRAEFAFADAMGQNPHFDVPAGHLENVLMQRLTFDPQKDAGIHKKIIEVDQHLLKVNPFNPFIRKNLAEAFYNLGDRNQACEQLLKAIEIEPNYVPAYLRLAEWYEEAGRHEESDKYRSQAIQVVNFYKDKTSLDPFEDMLLGRPPAATQQ
jgi:O-antigen ligase